MVEILVEQAIFMLHLTSFSTLKLLKLCLMLLCVTFNEVRMTALYIHVYFVNQEARGSKGNKGVAWKKR